MAEQQELNRPRCEHSACINKANWIVAYPLANRFWRLACNEHYQNYGGPGYLVGKLAGFVPVSSPVHPIGTPEP